MNKKKLAQGVFGILNRFPFVNRISARGCSVSLKGSILVGCRIRSRGKNNELVVKNGVLRHCRVTIVGSNNRVILEDGVHANFAEIHIEDNGNTVIIGKQTTLAGKVHFACTEGTQIRVGEQCLFSSDIVLRSGDSHSIVDGDGVRVNPAKDIEIGNRVWIGHRALITKGAEISDDSVVATGAIVTKAFAEPGVILAGVPAKVVKQDIKWLSERI